MKAIDTLARGMARCDEEIEGLKADRDAWKAKAERAMHLLAMVEDDIQDAYTLGMVRDAIIGNEVV